MGQGARTVRVLLTSRWHPATATQERETPVNTFRTRISRLAVVSALAMSLGGIAAGPALAKGTTMSAPVRSAAVEDGGNTIQGSCQYNPYNRCMD